MPFQKGHRLSKDSLRKRGKGRKTLLQEERRAIFDAKISQKWEEVIGELPATYIADQYLGKAPDKINHTLQFREYATLLKNNSLRKNSKDSKKIKNHSGRNGGGEDGSDSDVSDTGSDSGRETDPNEHSFREFSPLKKGGDKGLPEHNGGTGGI